MNKIFLTVSCLSLAALLGCSDPTPNPPVEDTTPKPSVEDTTPKPPVEDTTPKPPVDTTHWVGTWATAPQLTETNNNPPATLTNATLRQVVHVSIGGSQVRLKLTNAYGDGPAEIHAVHLARTVGATATSAIDATTDKALTFAGSASVKIAQGEAVTSDPVDFTVPGATNVTISIAFGATPAGITGHPGSRTTSYIVPGDATSSADLTSPAKTAHWYYIQALDVIAPAKSQAIAILGDSITDGRGTTTDGNDRWPDALALRLRASDATQGVAVLNLGIGGNNVVSGGLGPAGEARFDSDILGQSGVSYVVILEGVNDIGTASSADVAANLIDTYQTFVTKAHAQGLRVYGIPILPFKGNTSYDSPEHQTARDTVNAWIRTSGVFDAVIDVEAAVSDPASPGTLNPAFLYQDDYLHMNPAGYQALADAIDLGLFNTAN